MGLYTDRGLTLEQARDAALIELDVWYGGAVLDTFDCNELGTMHRYYCAEADQLRMLNGKVSNVSMTLICGEVPAQPDQDPLYDWKEHTSAECGKVHTAYVNFSKAEAEKYSAWKTQLNAATTVPQIDGILEQYMV